MFFFQKAHLRKKSRESFESPSGNRSFIASSECLSLSLSRHCAVSFYMLPCGLCQPSMLDLAAAWLRFEARCATQILSVKSAEQLARKGSCGWKCVA